MSIQRWAWDAYDMYAKPDGDWVAYADHVAAVEAATQLQWSGSAVTDARQQVIRDCIDVVEALHRHYDNGMTAGACSIDGHPWPCQTVAALRALLTPEPEQAP